MTKKFTDNRLPYAVVEAAVRGDAEALEKVLAVSYTHLACTYGALALCCV